MSARDHHVRLLAAQHRIAAQQSAVDRIAAQQSAVDRIAAQQSAVDRAALSFSAIDVINQGRPMVENTADLPPGVLNRWPRWQQADSAPARLAWATGTAETVELLDRDQVTPSNSPPRQQRLSPAAAVKRAKAEKLKAFVVTCPNCRGSRPPRPVLRAYKMDGQWVLEVHQRYVLGWQWVPKWLSELQRGAVLDVGHCGGDVDLTRAQIATGLRSGPRRVPADRLQAAKVS